MPASLVATRFHRVSCRISTLKTCTHKNLLPQFKEPSYAMPPETSGLRSQHTEASRGLQPLNLRLKLLDPLFHLLELLAGLLHPLTAFLHSTLDQFTHLGRHICPWPRPTSHSMIARSAMLWRADVLAWAAGLAWGDQPVTVAITARAAAITRTTRRRTARTPPIHIHPIDDAVELLHDPIESLRCVVACRPVFRATLWTTLWTAFWSTIWATIWSTIRATLVRRLSLGSRHEMCSACHEGQHAGTGGHSQPFHATIHRKISLVCGSLHAVNWRPSWPCSSSDSNSPLSRLEMGHRMLPRL